MNKQYKLVVDRIEQEMETKAEQEYDEEECENQETCPFSSEQLQEDHKHIQAQIQENKRFLHHSKNEVES